MAPVFLPAPAPPPATKGKTGKASHRRRKSESPDPKVFKHYTDEQRHAIAQYAREHGESETVAKFKVGPDGYSMVHNL